MLLWVPVDYGTVNIIACLCIIFIGVVLAYEIIQLDSNVCKWCLVLG